MSLPKSWQWYTMPWEKHCIFVVHIYLIFHNSDSFFLLFKRKYKWKLKRIESFSWRHKVDKLSVSIVTLISICIWFYKSTIIFFFLFFTFRLIHLTSFLNIWIRCFKRVLETVDFSWFVFSNTGETNVVGQNWYNCSIIWNRNIT
jgi:hypothetical protein